MQEQFQLTFKVVVDHSGRWLQFTVNFRVDFKSIVVSHGYISTNELINNCPECAPVRSDLGLGIFD